jgi:glycosyltransferase involved in cell wall biosynthesis
MSPRSALPTLLVVFYGNPDYYPPTYNAVSLLRSRFRVSVVSRRSETALRDWPDGVRVERVGPGRSTADIAVLSRARKLADLSEFVWAVRRALRAEAPRVVYAYEPHALVAATLAGCRAPIVYQRHEIEALERIDLRSLDGWVLRASLPASRRAKIVVFPEKSRAEYYQRSVPGLRTPVIVPNFPLRAAFPEPSFDALLSARFARRQVLYRGSVGAANGLREAVAALPLISPETGETTLRVCGRSTPAFLDELERLAAEKGVQGRVDFAGFIPFERLNRETLDGSVGLLLYQAVHLNWAYSASATNKLYEYAACGLPAVVPDRASYREMLGGEPWVELVDETDPRSIAAAITRILADRTRYDARCRAARRAFEERFNYEAVFAPLLDRIVALTDEGSP